MTDAKQSSTAFRLLPGATHATCPACPEHLKRTSYSMSDVTPSVFLENSSTAQVCMGYDYPSKCHVLMKSFDTSQFSPAAHRAIQCYAQECHVVHKTLLDTWVVFQDGQWAVFLMDPNIGHPLDAWLRDNAATVVLDLILRPLCEFLSDIHARGLVYGPFHVSDLFIVNTPAGPMLRAGRGACPVRFLRVGPPKASKKAVQAEPSAHYDAADAIAAMPAKELGVCVGGIPLPPPEYLTQPRTIGPQVDTWGVGVVAGYGFTAATAKIWANDSGNTRASLTLPKGLSWESKDLVALCLHSEMTSRPLAGPLLKHAAFDIIWRPSILQRILPCMAHPIRRDPEERWPVKINISLARSLGKDGVHKVWSVILKPGRPVEKPHGDLTASESMPERNSQDMQSADSSLPKLAGKISSFLVGSLEEKGSKGGVGNRRRGSSGAPGTLQDKPSMDSMASLFSLVSAFPACPEAQTAAQAILRARKIQTQRSGADAMQSFSAQNTSGERARANKKP